MSLYETASSLIGANERSAAVSDYLKTGGQNIDPATRAWCADFVNATLSQNGQQGTGSGMARSFLDWGKPVDTPRKGDIAVFSRGDSDGPYGHTGFFAGYGDDGTIQVLGGNQSDGVNVSGYDPNRLLGFRRGEEQQQNALAPEPIPQLRTNRLDVNDFLRRTV